MRCVSCDNKTKGEPEKFEFRCPSCGHRVSVSKSRDGLTDGAIKAALEAVGAAGELKVLPEHIGYEIVRRNAAKARKRKILLPVGIGLFVLAFFFDSLSLVLFIGGLVCFGIWLFRKWKSPKNVFSHVKRFLEINPAQNVVADGAIRRAGSGEHELAKTARQLLVCQHERYAAYLYASDFHLTNACPIAGPGARRVTAGLDGADERALVAGESSATARSEATKQLAAGTDNGTVIDQFPGILARMQASEDGKVLVLHDCTPSGEAFFQRVQTAPEWFGEAHAVQVVDLGLNAEHVAAMPGVSRPLTEIGGAAGNLSRASGVNNEGVEVTALRPSRLMSATGLALAAGVPLVLLAGAASGSGAGRSDSGG